MSGGQYLGHYFYSAGINPKELWVGNIVWDYRQPTRNFPYQHGEEYVFLVSVKRSGKIDIAPVSSREKISSTRGSTPSSM
jgi:hypothetical protein